MWEWVDLLVTSYKVNAQGAWITIAQTTPTTDMPISIIRPTSSTHAWWNDSWSSTQGLGDYYPGTNGSGGAALRGGGWSSGTLGGVLALLMSNAPSYVGPLVGFRCVFRGTP
ncbi:MAG: hypothetical protein JST16_05110 [Bdellovibrionales bacterium]|nr:hypothetical protein [Bdellovibrionales bacterium]